METTIVYWGYVCVIGIIYGSWKKNGHYYLGFCVLEGLRELSSFMAEPTGADLVEVTLPQTNMETHIAPF